MLTNVNPYKCLFCSIPDKAFRYANVISFPIDCFYEEKCSGLLKTLWLCYEISTIGFFMVGR